MQEANAGGDDRDVDGGEHADGGMAGEEEEEGLPSVATSLGGMELGSPAMLASGILGISLEIFDRLHEGGCGAVVTKSLSGEPWEGYANPTVFGVGGGGWLNAVGLSNPGAANFASMMRGYDNLRVPVIVSMVGSSGGVHLDDKRV